MKTVTIYSHNNWCVTSFGNGWGYLLEDVENRTSAWFQDNDASAFRANVMDNEGWFFDRVEAARNHIENTFDVDPDTGDLLDEDETS